MKIEDIWSEFISKTPQVTGFAVGPLHVWIKEREGDLLVKCDRDPERDSKRIELLTDPQPDEKGWKRLGSWEEVEKFSIKPCFPSRAVVVRPEFTYTLLPSERVQFFMGVPLSLSICRPNGEALFVEPVTVLSNTWFGTAMEGELCFAMRTLARRKHEQLDFDPWRVVCPVRVRNQSKEMISFERLCLRVQYLSIYRDAHRGLWANESSVNFRGNGDETRVAYAKSAPALLSKPELITQGSEDPNGTFLYRALSQGKGFFQ
jgi:hypothetical protein